MDVEERKWHVLLNIILLHILFIIILYNPYNHFFNSSNQTDKQKLGDVRNSAQKHNSKLDQLREEQFTDQKKKWNLKREVKQLIHEEINRVEEARKEEREEEALIKEAAAKDLVEYALLFLFLIICFDEFYKYCFIPIRYYSFMYRLSNVFVYYRPEYYGRKLSRTQAEFLAKRQAQQQASKGQKSAKAEEGEKKKEETDAPAKKKRVKGVKKE